MRRVILRDMRRVLLFPTIVLLLLAVICFLISAGPFAGGAANGEEQGERPIVFCSLDDVSKLDVGKMSWATDIRAAMALWEGLAAYEPKTLIPVPGVASSWEISDAGKTYTFHLRENARWSNGDPVTAGDFIFAWKRVLTPATGADYIDLLSVIVGAEDFTRAMQDNPGGDPNLAGVAAPDPHTLIVHLRAPCAYFLDLCAFPPLFPLNAAAMRPFYNAAEPQKGYDAAWSHPPNIVTNGAFKLVEWKFKQYLQLEPNAYYWDRSNVQCSRLLLKTISKDETAALLAFQSGTVDALSFVPQKFGEDLLAAQQAGGFPEVHYRPVFGSYYYVINCQKPPFNDRRVRKALALAIDRKVLVTQVTRMKQEPLGLLVPPDSIPGYKSPEPLQEDVPLARQLLAEAGFPDGAGFPLIEILASADSPIHGQIAEAIGQMWKRNLGVNAKVKSLERASFSGARQSQDFQVARGGWYGDYTDPTTWLDLLRSKDGNNDGRFSNADYDALMDKAAAEADPARRFELLRQAEGILVQDELPLIPLYQYGDGFIYDEKKILGLDVNVRLLTQLKWIRRAPGT